MNTTNRPEGVEATLELALQNPFAMPAPPRRAGYGAADAEGWAAWWKSQDELFGVAEPFRLAAYVGTHRDDTGRPDDAAQAAARRIVALTDAGVPFDCEMAELACRARAVRRSLERLAGDGREMARVRAAGWSAAFGPDLFAASGLGELISRTPVLILGETGTGKELLAQSLLLAAPGTFEDGRWQPAETDSVNLAGLPSDLVASTLFGHERGAYTGASKPRVGLLERCHGAAVFLDEVADLPAPAQVGLLRSVQEGQVRRLGADKDTDAAPRIISATHRDMEQLVAAERFRIDLYYRLRAVVIELPALRERRGDILPLAEHLARSAVSTNEQGRVMDSFRALLRDELEGYPWPGNVRELLAMLHTLALGMKPRLINRPPTPIAEALPSGIRDCTWTEKRLQGWYAQRVMERSHNASAAAQTLAIHRNTLAKRLGEHRE